MIPTIQIGGIGRRWKDNSLVDVFSLLNMPGADGSTSVTDETGIPWIVAGNTQIDTSLGYNSLLFDGAGDYIRTTSTRNIVGSAFCLEQWLYMTAAPSGSSAYIICQDDGTNDGQNFQFYISTGRVLNFVGWSTSARGSFWAADSGATLVPLNTLVHVAADYDAHPTTPKTRLFIAGSLVGERAGTHWAGATLPVAIGSFIEGPNDESAFAKYNGHIVSSRISKLSLYTASFTPPSPPLGAP